MFVACSELFASRLFCCSSVVELASQNKKQTNNLIQIALIYV
jgi:hypothetical protein